MQIVHKTKYLISKFSKNKIIIIGVKDFNFYYSIK